MLDLEIRPNYEKMVKEKKNIENFLEITRSKARMKGIKTESGLNDARRELRDDL